MLLGKTQKTKCMTVWQRVIFFGMCMSHLSHMSRSESSTVNDLWDKGLYEKLLWPRRWNCARFDDHCVKGSFNPFDGSLPLRMKLKRSISTRSLPSKAPQNSSPQKCFFHTGPANPGYLASSSVDPGKGLKCVQCVGHASSSHTRNLYILRFLHLLRLLISSASKLWGLSNRHRETSHFLEGSSVTQLPHKMLMLQHCLCLVHAGLYSRCCFACCQNILKPLYIILYCSCCWQLSNTTLLSLLVSLLVSRFVPELLHSLLSLCCLLGELHLIGTSRLAEASWR